MIPGAGRGRSGRNSNTIEYFLNYHLFSRARFGSPNGVVRCDVPRIEWNAPAGGDFSDQLGTGIELRGGPRPRIAGPAFMFDAHRVEIRIHARPESRPGWIHDNAGVKGSVVFLDILMHFAVFANAIVGRDGGLRIVKPRVGSGQCAVHDMHHDRGRL